MCLEFARMFARSQSFGCSRSLHFVLCSCMFSSFYDNLLFLEHDECDEKKMEKKRMLRCFMSDKIKYYNSFYVLSAMFVRNEDNFQIF